MGNRLFTLLFCLFYLRKGVEKYVQTTPKEVTHSNRFSHSHRHVPEGNKKVSSNWATIGQTMGQFRRKPTQLLILSQNWGEARSNNPYLPTAILAIQKQAHHSPTSLTDRHVCDIKRISRSLFTYHHFWEERWIHQIWFNSCQINCCQWCLCK